MWFGLPIILVALALAAPAAADVTGSGDSGFATHNEVVVSASPAQVWAALVAPARWWNKEHTWSGNAANLSLQPVAGGCFCERLPGGGVQHMRVIHADRAKLLRMTGGLGPLQAEAVTGTLSVELAAVDGKTRIKWDYVVGGYMRAPMAQLAPVVDGVMAEQLGRLAALFAR
jgi:uncharacterized protein YndB with AHSA1/START domain